jgi:hypothetical protein
MAGPATHVSAEADSLVVRVDPEARASWLAEAPEAYYVTEPYSRHPVVLVRLANVDDITLRDILAASWRLTSAKAPSGRAGQRAGAARSILPRPIP